MKMKYYDLLSTCIVGIIIVFVVNYFYNGNQEIDGIIYFALGYVTGYFINSIGSLLEKFYYIIIGGKPANKLLKENNDKNYNGFGKIRLYNPNDIIKKIKNNTNNPNPSIEEIFNEAKNKVMVLKEGNTRCSDFNAQYALSRSILTVTFISYVLIAIVEYHNVIFWVIGTPVLFLSWNRYKERAYYYAKEILIVYDNCIKI